MKKVIKVLLALLLLVLPTEMVSAQKFTLDRVGELDSDEIFVDDINIFCAPGEDAGSPGSFVKYIQDMGADYWKTGLGNYYVIVEQNRNSYIRGVYYSLKNVPTENIPYLFVRNNGGDLELTLATKDSYFSALATKERLDYRFYDAGGANVQLQDGAFGDCEEWEFLDFELQGYYENLRIYDASCRIITNVPFFLDNDALNDYLTTGNIDGAVNAEQIDNMLNPKNEVSYSNALKLNNLQYYGSYLDMSVIEDKYFSFEYMPEYEEYSIDDLYIEAMYQYSYAWSILNQPSKFLSGCNYANYYYPLKDYRNSLKIYPYVVVNDYMGMLPNLSKACCGGSVNGSDVGLQLGDAEITASSIAKISTSILSVNLRLVYKKGQKVVASSRSYTQDVNLLTGDCDFHYSNIDEETDEYKKDENPYKTTDKDGNTKVNNTIDGGNNSSSTGGNANINNTIKFPDRITLDLNVNGIPLNTTQVIVNNGGSSSDVKLPDFVQGAGSGVGDFMKYLFTGFGLFDGNSGIVQFLQANFSYVPHDYWLIYMFAFCGLILVAFIMRFFR